jgi:hypothetical protein
VDLMSSVLKSGFVSLGAVQKVGKLNFFIVFLHYNRRRLFVGLGFILLALSIQFLKNARLFLLYRSSIEPFK